MDIKECEKLVKYIMTTVYSFMSWTHLSQNTKYVCVVISIDTDVIVTLYFKMASKMTAKCDFPLKYTIAT